MKKFIFLLSFFLIQLSTNAQEIAIPDFSKRPFYISTENELESLEREIAVVDYKIKGLGYGGGEYYYTVTQPRSLLRFSLREMPRFIIKTEPNQDPSEVIYLSKSYDVNRKRKRFLTSKVTMLGKSKGVDNQFIEINFKKLDEDVYEIIIVDPIGNGEYAFIPFDTAESSQNMMGKVYINCFGID